MNPWLFVYEGIDQTRRIYVRPSVPSVTVILRPGDKIYRILPK